MIIVQFYNRKKKKIRSTGRHVRFSSKSLTTASIMQHWTSRTNSARKLRPGVLKLEDAQNWCRAVTNSHFVLCRSNPIGYLISHLGFEYGPREHEHIRSLSCILSRPSRAHHDRMRAVVILTDYPFFLHPSSTNSGSTMGVLGSKSPRVRLIWYQNQAASQ